jgi:2-polyprenyl-3-methyl-5-hydroxy-6-metoxy-1,4-benzoquinol methylase
VSRRRRSKEPRDVPAAAAVNETRRFYDLRAERTAEEWYDNPVLLPTLKDFMSLLPAGPRVLDLGCGPGYESMRLHTLGAEVVGVDFSAQSIDIARRRNPECRFELMDFFDIDAALGSFHGVFASGSVIHVPPERVGDLAEAMRAILSPGGIWEIITRDGQGQTITHPEMNGETLTRVIQLYSREELADRLERKGFQYLRAGALDEFLVSHGWKCHVFRKASTA